MNLAEYYKKSEPVFGVAKILFLRLFELYEHYPISKIAKSTSGGTPNRGNAEYYNGNIPWLKSGELNDSIIKDCSEFITEEGLKNSSAKLFPKDTLLVAMYGATAGKTGILNFDASTNQAVCALFPNAKVERDYLHWFLKQHRIDFIIQSKGGAQPNISQKVIKETSIPVPPLEIQKEIIAFLNDVQNDSFVNRDFDVLDDISLKRINQFFKIRNTHEILNAKSDFQKQLLTQLKQSILQEAIQGKLTADWRSNRTLSGVEVEPASELLKRIKAEKDQLIKDKKIKKEKALPPITEEEIPFELPEGWVWCRLGEITTYGSSEKIDSQEIKQDTWVLDLEDIEKESSKILQFKTFSERPSLSTKSVFKKGWVLYSKLRPYLDKVVVVPKDGVCTTEILPLPVYSNLIAGYFLYTLKGKHFLSYVNSKVGGMKMPRLGTDDGKMALIPIAPVEEQKAIVEKVETLMQKCQALEQEIKTSETNAQMLMQAVLKEAFEGKQEVVEV